MVSSPEALLSRYRVERDENALAGLFSRCLPELTEHACRLGHDPASADEIAHEALLMATRDGSRYDGARPLLPWLRGVVERLGRDLSRRRQRRPDPARMRPTPSPDPLQQASANELVATLRRALGGLPEAYREVLELQLFEDLEPVRIAERIGRRPGTVRVRLHRGLRMLRRRLPPGFALGTAIALLVGRGSASPPPHRPWLRRPQLLSAAAVLAVAFVTAVSFAPSEPAGRVAEPRTAALPANAMPPRSEPPNTTPRRRPVGRAAPARAAGLVVAVNGENGEPLASKGVRLLPAGGFDPRVHLRRAATDASGRARFGGLAPGVYRVLCEDGTERECSVRAGGPSRCAFTVAGGLDVTVSVVDASGGPLAGAEVWVSDAGDAYAGTVVGRTGRTGRLALHALRRGSFVAARARFAARSDVVLLDGAPEVELRLGRGGGVRGEVRSQDGEPVAGARILVGAGPDVRAIGLASGIAKWKPPSIELRSDAHGRFAVEGIEPGRQPVVVYAAGYGSVARYVDVTALRDTDLVVELAPGATLRGRVLGASGEPLVAELCANGRSEHLRVELQTGRDGHFVLDGLPPGHYGLAARADRHQAVATGLELGAGEQVERDLVLQPLAAVGGTIRGAGGEPLAGCGVQATFATLQSFDVQVVRAVTDDNGHYRLAMPDGVDATYWIREAGAPLWLQAPGGPDIRVPDAMRARSFVACRLDASMAGAALWLRPDPGRWVRAGTVAEDGGVRIGPLVPGTYRVFAEAVHPEQVAVTSEPVTVVAGGTAAPSWPEPVWGEVAFRIARDDGVPLADPVVSLCAPGGMCHALRGQAEGVQRLRPGCYTLHSMCDNGEWIDGHPFEVRAGQRTEVSVAVRAAVRRRLQVDTVAARLRGHARRAHARLLDAAGAQVATFNVALDTVPVQPCEVFLPVGRYRILLEAGAERVAGRFAVPDLAPSFAPLVAR